MKKRDPFVLFGVRACDYKAFEVLDKVFMNDPKDTYYANRREAGIIVTLACFDPKDSCFCPTFGIDATNPQGDLTAYSDEKYLYLKANDEKGEALLSAIGNLGGLLEDTKKADEKALESKKAEAKVLRYPRFQSERRRNSFPLLGFLHVFRLHADGRRQPENHADAEIPSAFHAQTRVLSQTLRRHVFLRRVRSLRGKVPSASEYRESDQRIF